MQYKKKQMSVSIGIPFYNAEKFLIDSIKSVFAQSYSDWELILLDDGSTDHSLEIARSIKDKRIRVLSDGLNRKLPYRLNQITREAKYEIIARMDADDLMSPFRIEKQLAILENNPNIDLVTTGLCSLSKDLSPIGIRTSSSKTLITGKRLLMGQAPIVHASILGNRSWFQRNLYDETEVLTEDYEIWLRAFSKNDLKIYVLDQPLYYYREEGTVTKSKALTAYKNQRRLMRASYRVGFTKGDLILGITKNYLKSVTVSFLDSIDKMDYLIQRRNMIIDVATIKSVVSDIEYIRSIHL